MPSDLKNSTAANSTTTTPSGKTSEIVMDLASPCCASHERSCLKENININKCETPKLNVERLQMKRKKKGGGYNLRKSLAWDRAFFTEEGVLDPLELSIISGASCRKEFPVIKEDASGGSHLIIEPLDLQGLKNNNPLKELPDEDLGNDRKDCLSPKPNSSSSTSLTSDKVSTCIGSKSGSKWGDCPRPLPSSSLKRPATMNACKAAAKELKLPKVPGLRPGSSPSCATKSSILRTNCVKHNQIAQPGLKIFSKGLKNTQNASKASSFLPTCHPAQNSSKSSLKRHSSINMSPLPGKDAYALDSKMIAASMSSSRPVNSAKGPNQSTTFAATYTQNAHVSGRIMHLSQNQTMKPSGLRMPSPSLSFFSQPRASILNGLSLRDIDTDVCGSQKPGNMRLQDTLKRTSKMVNNVTESASNSSMAISSRSRCLRPSNANVVSNEIVKSNIEGKSVQKMRIKVLSDVLNSNPIGNQFVEDNKHVDEQIQNCLSKRKGTGRIKSMEDADLLKVDREMPLHSEISELGTDDINLKKVIHSCREKGESCRSGRRNPEQASEQNNATHRSETENEIDEPQKEQDTSNYSISNHDVNFGIQCEDVTDHGEWNSLMTPSDWENTCKPDCHKPCLDQIAQLNYPLSATDKRNVKNTNALKIKERASQLGEVSQLHRAQCSEGANTEALERRRANTRSSDFGSNHQDANLLKEAAIGIMTDKLLAEEAHMQDTMFASTIADCKNNANLISESGHNTKQSGKYLMAQNVCPGIELNSQRNDEFQVSDRWLPEKLLCLQKSQQEEIIETLSCAVLDKSNGIISNETKMESSQARDEKHGCNFEKVKAIGHPLRNTEFKIVDNSLSFDRQNNFIQATFNHDGLHTGKANNFELDVPSGDTMRSVISVDGRWEDRNCLRIGELKNVLLQDPANENLSNNLYQDNQTMEIDYCGSFPKSRMHEESQEYRKVINMRQMTEDVCQNNQKSSTLPLHEGGSDIDYQGNIADSGKVLLQSPESNMLNECCIEHLENLELPNVVSVDEKLSHSNDELNFKNHLQSGRIAFDNSYEDNALGNMFASVAQPNTSQIGNIKNSSVSAQELPLNPENCNKAQETDNQRLPLDAITDPSRIELFSDPSTSEVAEEINNSFDELHPKLDHVNIKSAFAPDNKYEDDLSKKSHVSVLPQNTIPFSDEWLAAIEAAGEDILTRKGGAVQNSPPDKSLPEPSPWSPVGIREETIFIYRKVFPGRQLSEEGQKEKQSDRTI